MKALDILQNENIFDEEYLANNKFLKQNINEAIKELESLHDRSCEKCYSFYYCSIVRVLKGGIITPYFYCNDFEPKDKQ